MVFSLYLIGFLMAVFTGVLFRKTFSQTALSPLLLELPVYRLPVWRTVFLGTARKLRVFLWRAGKLIVPVCMLLGILNAIPVSENQSLLVGLSQFIQPLFAPMGISPDNWPAVVGLITGVLAKEVVVGSLNHLYAGMAGLSQMFDGAIGAYAYLLFILLYIPCVSTVAVMRAEAGKKIMMLSVIWSTLLAYGVAVLFYQLGTFSVHPAQSLYWASVVMLGLVTVVYWIRSDWFQGGGRALSAS